MGYCMWRLGVGVQINVGNGCNFLGVKNEFRV